MLTYLILVAGTFASIWLIDIIIVTNEVLFEINNK